eukprot:10844221-Alexandrium_andersonii.AAC.1
MSASLVGSEMCIRDRQTPCCHGCAFLSVPACREVLTGRLCGRMSRVPPDLRRRLSRPSPVPKTTRGEPSRNWCTAGAIFQ